MHFKIEVPQEYAGRVLADIVKMSGTMDGQEISGETTVITGHCPGIYHERVFTVNSQHFPEVQAGFRWI